MSKCLVSYNCWPCWCREEKAPSLKGDWLYDWRSDARQYVKNPFADGALAILAEQEPRRHQDPPITLESHVRP